MSEKPKPVRIEDREYYTALSHFYRGELGRIMVWRQRLDTTTNWAILAATALITWALGHSEIPHVVFMLANVMIFLLLAIEGRRYRYYDAYRARVRILEAHFLVPAVLRSEAMVMGDWREMLAEDLLLPSFKIGVRESISRRLKRNYIWIFLILLVAWILKIFLHAGSMSGPIKSWREFLIRAQAPLSGDQPFPPWLFWTTNILFYGGIIWLLLYSQKDRYASGEMERRAPTNRRWKI